MFDGASLETVVVDDPDEQPRPVRGRVSTGELTVHVLSGVWHRRMPDGSETSCGEELMPRHMAFLPTRREDAVFGTADLVEPLGTLCEECFTPRELAKAAEKERERVERDDAQYEAFWRNAKTRGLPNGDP
jgi:hypothetical protein